MDRLHTFSRFYVFILFITLITSYSNAVNVVVMCNQTNDTVPSEVRVVHRFNPSALNSLSVGLTESQTSLAVNWSINIDGSIRSLTGTWLTVSALHFLNDDLNYRCHYQPQFTSEQNNLTGIQQLYFSYTLWDVPVVPDAVYDVHGYNIPPPSPGKEQQYIKRSSYEAQGCESKLRKKLLCDAWDADVSSVLHDEKVVVTFMTTSMSDRYTIKLKKETDTLNIEIAEVRNVEKRKVEVSHCGSCEDLVILITAHVGYCNDGCVTEHQPNCNNRSGVIFTVGFVLLFLLILFCCCITRQTLRRGRSSVAVCSRVLVVYPAVDCVFQHAVMVLAEFLQSAEDARVVIDAWERASLAEHGLIRWLHTQAELADAVLLILPPQHTHAEDEVKLNLSGVLVSHHAVSASASSLFALTLNLITSSAHQPHRRDKFLVVHLDGMEEKRNVPVEVRACRTFVLPRDLQKLRQTIRSRSNVQRSSPKRRFTSFSFNDTSRKVKEALEQLEMPADTMDVSTA